MAHLQPDQTGELSGIRPRRNNRRLELMRAAAHCFVAQGYAATTMREIAAAAGMQPGSIYYHFSSKLDLLTAVHEEGLRRITAATGAALDRVGGDAPPWERLEAAACAHMSALLEGDVFFTAVMRDLPDEDTPSRERVTALRDDYERIFSRLLADLGLPRDVDARTLRLMLMGAMNWAHGWYRKDGDTPDAIARKFIRYLRQSLSD